MIKISKKIALAIISALIAIMLIGACAIYFLKYEPKIVSVVKHKKTAPVIIDDSYKILSTESA